MRKHTPEPWPFFVEWAEPSTPHPESEPIVRLSYDDYQRARYCVNACQGVSNGQLALTSVSGTILMLKEAEQQRDELLAACLKLVEWDDSEKNHSIPFMERVSLCDEAFSMMRSAIAKTKVV